MLIAIALYYLIHGKDQYICYTTLTSQHGLDVMSRIHCKFNNYVKRNSLQHLVTVNVLDQMQFSSNKLLIHLGESMRGHDGTIYLVDGFVPHTFRNDNGKLITNSNVTLRSIYPVWGYSLQTKMTIILGRPLLDSPQFYIVNFDNCLEYSIKRDFTSFQKVYIREKRGEKREHDEE